MIVDSQQRAKYILEVITSIAALNFSKKAPVSDHLDEMDAIAAGVNMLGEELERSTVSLKEKEILLKEIHHRVKNNLQIVSSLLRMQVGFITDPVAIEQLNRSVDRIKNMALIHENLYKFGELSAINVEDYIDDMLSSMSIDLLENKDVYVETTFNGQDITLDIERAVPFGLLLNELVTNSIKHAFPDNDYKGEINVIVSKDSKQFTLEIKDNGIGLPMNFEEIESESLGKHLIEAFVEQLDAEMTVTSHKDKGTCFSISF